MAEPPPPEPPAGPSVVEQHLQAEAEHVRKELESLAGELQAQNNQNKSALQLEQQVKELQEKLSKLKEREHLEATSQPNQQLQAQLSLMALPGQGDGGGHLDNEEEEVPRPMLSILEDLESREVAFFNSAGASAQEKQARLCGQLKEQRVWCQCLTHLVALAQKESKAVAPAPGTEGESVCGQTHQALQGAMEKLQSDFMDLLKEKADVKEQVEKLELRFVHLAGKTDTIRKYITTYESQRAVPKMRHQEGDIIRLAQDTEEMKVKLLELQNLVLRLGGNHNEGCGKFLAAAQNPADDCTPGAQAPRSLGLLTSRGIFVR
uniref:Golgin subfamily A conserved domain-containing protein n=1 Tax=Chlorocebus sabaeus TaxID=60711 RepID=A0A0D9RGW1_CHLSB